MYESYHFFHQDLHDCSRIITSYVADTYTGCSVALVTFLREIAAQPWFHLSNYLSMQQKDTSLSYRLGI